MDVQQHTSRRQPARRLRALLLLAAREVVGEGLGLVDRLLLALGVVGVDLGRLRVPGRLTTAEALAALAHGNLGHRQLRRHHRRHEGGGEREAEGNEEHAEHHECLFL